MNVQTDAVPAGFIELPFGAGENFLSLIGPLWCKRENNKLILGFRVEKRHCNIGGICHGGMLMTFADMQLGLGARFHAEEDFGFMPTVNMTADFLAPAALGAWVEGRTDLLRSTRNFIFCQGIITSNGAPAVRASGIMKSGGAPVSIKGLPNLRSLLK
ncbi:MAG: PaaI family thioesterase [Rhizobiales bacterium]|nr:PaaI family thioesterase [Hyphomicrobiales bacterium]